MAGVGGGTGPKPPQRAARGSLFYFDSKWGWRPSGSNLSFDGTTLTVNAINVTGSDTNLDGSFALLNTADNTKVAKFSAAGITTATTRTYTLPDTSDTLAVLGLAQTWALAQTFSANVIINSATTTGIFATSTSAQAANGGAAIIAACNDGSVMTSGNRLGDLVFRGLRQVSGNTQNNSASVEGFATETWSNTASGAKMIFQTTPNGTITRVTALTLDQDQSATFAGILSAAALNSNGTTSNIMSGTIAGDYLIKVACGSATGLGIRVQAGADGLTAYAVRNAASAISWSVLGNGNMAVSGVTTISGQLTTTINSGSTINIDVVDTAASRTAQMVRINSSATAHTSAYLLDVISGASTSSDLMFRLRANSVNLFTVGADGTTAISGNVTIASGKTLQLGAAYSAGVVAATGTIAIKDSSGTTYNVLVHT